MILVMMQCLRAKSRPLGVPVMCCVCLARVAIHPSILAALAAASAKKMITVALLGKGGGKAHGMAQHEIIIPSDDSGRIQEMQHANRALCLRMSSNSDAYE